MSYQTMVETSLLVAFFRSFFLALAAWDYVIYTQKRPFWQTSLSLQRKRVYLDLTSSNAFLPGFSSSFFALNILFLLFLRQRL